MKTLKLTSTDFIGLGPGGRVLYADDIKKMRIGDEFTNVTTFGELALRATKYIDHRLVLQLEERYYDDEGVLQNTAVVAKYQIERW